MKCDKCNNEATVIFKQNINGNVTKQYLCEKCAESLNLDIGMKNIDNFYDIIDNMFNFNFSDYLTIDKHKSVKCSCGNNYSDFINNAQLSCENCYDTYRTDIDNLLKKLQGSNIHVGKKYIQDQEENKHNNNITDEITIESLKRELEKAIKEERYEDAAVIRDEIKKRGN